MNYNPFFVPRAKIERDEAIVWYAEQSHKAALNFIEELGKTIDNICLDPYRYRNLRKNYRELRMKKFPFYIVYLIDEDKRQVRILTVYHTSRNPEYKYRGF